VPLIPDAKGSELVVSTVGQPGVDRRKARKGGAVAGEFQRQLPAALDDAGRHAHQFLHHRFEPPAFRRVPDRRVLAGQPFEADPAQDVMGEHRARHDEIVGGEFARWRPLVVSKTRLRHDVEVGLELGMELLGRGMVAIQRDHFLIGADAFAERRPPAFDRDLGHQQPVAVFVDRAFAHAHDATARARLAVVLLRDVDRENADTLAFARHTPGRLCLRALEPGLQILAARVPLAGLLAEIRKFDREALTIAAAQAFHAARSEQLWWRDTIRTLRAIDGEAADAAAFELQNDANAVIRAAKAVCEVAACEAPLTGGVIPAQYQLEELILRRALMLFFNGQIFHSIRGGLMPAELRISPAGDVLSERMTAADLVKPGASWLHKRILDQAERGYGAARKSEEATGRIPWDPEFRAAIEHEYAASSEAYFDLQFALMRLAEQAGRDVIAIRRSKLIEFLANCPEYPKADVTGLLQRLTLRCRPTWNSGLSDNETDLSRFDRKHSLINWPLLAIDDAPDPLLVVAPGLVSEAAVYAIGGLHNGDLNNAFWESDQARKLAGAMGNKAGRAFERKVARTLCDHGLEARNGCKIAKLLDIRLTDDPGDIDVFLLSRDRRRAWVIEAKELRLCRTEGEAASRLNEYRGLMQRDKKGRDRPDKLLKHLRRVQLMRENSAKLAAALGLAQPPEIKGLLVFDTPQPMNFRRVNDSPDAACVFLDRIAEFEF
jgi:hypothetical protein